MAIRAMILAICLLGFATSWIVEHQIAGLGQRLGAIERELASYD
jgi:hypothetical protein